MSLTPPKFIQMLRKRDQDDLVERLRALADDWDSQSFDINSSGKHAKELREVLDAYH